VIVDLDRSGKAAGGRSPLMAVAVAVLAVGFAALVLRAPDPASADRARARVLAALPAPAVTPPPAPVGRMLGPSVLAVRTSRPSLPPLLTLPQDVATFVPAGTADATRQVQFAVSETSRPIVYRLVDGRMFVIQQTPPDRGRPVLATYGFEEGTIRGQPAQFFNSSIGPVRALVWWIEGPASYYVYSSTLSVRELIRLAEQLR
jgi:hypothetical protein